MTSYLRVRVCAGLCWAILLTCVSGPVLAAEVFEPLNGQDRVLVLAPHPDDETIGAAGVLQQAVEKKLPVKVVYLTNGDSNEWSFLLYEKRPVLKRAAVIAMGQLRRQEAVAAMRSLGVPSQDLIFLGYPDMGTFQMFAQYWGVTLPFRSALTRVTKVPYGESFSAGAPYVGESVLRDLKRIIADFKPTRILVSHPLDNNPDHRAFYLFLRVALWDLQGKVPPAQIYPYLVHEGHWPQPRGFQPEMELTPSAHLQDSGILWQRADLNVEQVLAKKSAIDLYKTQIQYSANYLYSFARKNELFGDYPSIILQEQPSVGQSGDFVDKIDWQSIEQRQGIDIEPVDEDGQETHVISSLAYAQRGGFLYIKLGTATWKDKLLGVNIFLSGYRRGLPFAYMPKYRLKVTFSKFVAVYEKGRRVFIKDMEVARLGSAIIIKFPLVSLENPHYILSSVRANISQHDVDRTAWRVLELE